MKKPRRGRPVLPEGEKKQVFALRLTADERGAIEQAAEAEGVSVSEWARSALLRAANDL